jgi:hypothetical protein
MKRSFYENFFFGLLLLFFISCASIGGRRRLKLEAEQFELGIIGGGLSGSLIPLKMRDILLTFGLSK